MDARDEDAQRTGDSMMCDLAALPKGVISVADEANIRLAFKELPRQLVQWGPIIAAPQEYIGHRTLILAFKRGVLLGMNPELANLSRAPRWYTGEETSRALERGWAIGRHRLQRQNRHSPPTR